MVGDVSGTTEFDQDPMPTSSIQKERKRKDAVVFTRHKLQDSQHRQCSRGTREAVNIAKRARWRGAR